MEIPIYQVDSFTNQPFKGNPAGVCILTEKKLDSWMQNVAFEMNLSETAFALPEGDGYRLRWFTPRVEVDLCGHATLATAYIFWQTGRADKGSELRFNTRSGLLTAKYNDPWIELNFPLSVIKPATAPEGMMEALGIDSTFIGYDGTDYLVEVAHEAVVRAVQPDFELLEEVSTRGVIVTAKASTKGYDFVSRFFGPQVGIPEDPVTGSAHCALAPYWRGRLGKDTFMAYQASARGGELKLRIEGERVIIGGQAVAVFEGKLNA